MAILLIGLVLFFSVHAFTMARPARAKLIARLGEGPYKGVYSLLAGIGLVLIIWGYGRYRASGYIPVWDPPRWTRDLAIPLVWFAFIAVIAAYAQGHIKAWLKHPMLAGVKAWAVAHLLANGDLGSIILFGSFLVWAVAARIAAKRRDEGLPQGAPAAPSGWRNDIIAVAAGTILALAFVFWLHVVIIGVPILPA